MECIELADDIMFGKPIVCCLENKEKFNKLQTFCFGVLKSHTDELNHSLFARSLVVYSQCV